MSKNRPDMNIELINPKELTAARFLALFELFPRTEQVKIARTIWEKPSPSNGPNWMLTCPTRTFPRKKFWPN